MSVPLQIRPALADDAEALAAFGRQAFSDTYGAMNTPENLAAYLDAAFALPQIAAEIADPACTFLMGEQDARLLGYAQLRDRTPPPCVTQPLALELARIYVDRSAIGQGLGKALMAACHDVARARGYRWLWLGVWERNQRAQAFYTRRGFSLVGEHDFVVGQDRQRDLVFLQPVTP